MRIVDYDLKTTLIVCSAVPLFAASIGLALSLLAWWWSL